MNLNNKSPLERIKALEENPWLIADIKAPNNDEVKLCLSLEPMVLKCIKKPSEESTLLAISIYSQAIDCLESPTEATKMLASIKCQRHDRYLRNIEYGVLATTYRFLNRNSAVIASALAKADSLTTFEELVIQKQAIKAEIIKRHPALEQYL